jgi:hypothetical protein
MEPEKGRYRWEALDAFVNQLNSPEESFRYWQNDSEPNSPIYWAGTKDQFIRELKIFHKAVKDADPSAIVVAGGYDGLFNPPGTHPMPGQEKGLEFFDTAMRVAADAFDVFDLRLYADPYTIPWRVDYIRGRMKALRPAMPMAIPPRLTQDRMELGNFIGTWRKRRSRRRCSCRAARRNFRRSSNGYRRATW